MPADASTHAGDGPGSGAGAGGSHGGSAALAAIRRRIERVKMYPTAARQRELEGDPLVEFALTADGGVAYAQIIRTSGETFLDAAAIATIRRGAPYPYVAGPIRLTLRYRIEP